MKGGSEGFGAAQLEPEPSCQEANKSGPSGALPAGSVPGCWEHAALVGLAGVLQCSGPRQITQGTLLPLCPSVLLLSEVRLKWTSGKPSEFGKISYNMAAGSRGAWSGSAWCQGMHGGAGEQGGKVIGVRYFE